MNSEADVPLYFHHLTYRERKLNCPVNPQTRKWISHWLAGCWIAISCLEIAMPQQHVSLHLILRPMHPWAHRLAVLFIHFLHNVDAAHEMTASPVRKQWWLLGWVCSALQQSARSKRGMRLILRIKWAAGWMGWVYCAHDVKSHSNTSTNPFSSQVIRICHASFPRYFPDSQGLNAKSYCPNVSLMHVDRNQTQHK